MKRIELMTQFTSNKTNYNQHIKFNICDICLKVVVDTVFCPGLKSKFPSIESCFGSGIHFPLNPKLSKSVQMSISFKSKFPSPGPSLFSESIQFIFSYPFQSNFRVWGCSRLRPYCCIIILLF